MTTGVFLNNGTKAKLPYKPRLNLSPIPWKQNTLPLSEYAAKMKEYGIDARRQLIATRQTTCLFVTHDVDEALALGQRLFVMQAGRVARQWNAPWRADEARSQIVQALRAADASSALSVSAAAPVSPVSFP